MTKIHAGMIEWAGITATVEITGKHYTSELGVVHHEIEPPDYMPDQRRCYMPDHLVKDVGWINEARFCCRQANECHELMMRGNSHAIKLYPVLQNRYLVSARRESRLADDDRATKAALIAGMRS